jgi:fructose-1,6-bisphosphatase I
MSQIGLTLTRHLLREQQQHPRATGEFTSILSQLATAAKVVSREVNKAGLVDILGFTGEKNVTGDEIQKLDIYAHEVFQEALGYSGHFCVMASEEDAGPISIPDGVRPGSYAIAFDPLDGSSNIEVNVSIGTIFSIHRRVTSEGRGTAADLLQTGSSQIAAGYVVYGSATMLVFSTGTGVHGFTLDPSVGEFLLSHENIRIPARGKTYSVNESYSPRWAPAMRKFVEGLKESGDYTARYIGSMVSDVHRTLLRGGIFMYPGDQESPEGKLRLLYEGAPMAYLVEQAGGAASTGSGPILDIKPTDLHQRTPVFLGSVEDVRALERALASDSRD